MNVTILNGSPRRHGNTEIMAAEFQAGAEQAGHDVTLINLADKKIAGCLGCKYCFEHEGTCVQKDDMADILHILDETDLLVFASPIYWFGLTGQIKCAIDRMYARGMIGFHFSKTALLLDSGADNVYDASLTQYRAMCSYLQWESIGEICIPDMAYKGSMAKSPLLEQVRELGAALR